MRKTAAIGLLLCWVCAGEETPTSRCVVAAKPAEMKTVPETGVPELDKRIKSECGFMNGLFGVEPEFVLLAGNPPRKAFAVSDGKGTVFVSAAWLQQLWGSEHRVATVASVIAHQYAHILQEKRKCPLPEWSRERHADYLAGWYLGKRNVATLGSGTDLDAAFAASLFSTRDEYLNARFDHGAPDMRAAAIKQGFNAFRAGKLSLDKAYTAGLAAFPPPNEGLADGSERPAGLLGRIKVECLHKGPCNHEVACTHPKPCTHKVACKHESPCVHHTPCVHRVDCVHTIPCVHKTRCVHRTRCEHKVPCVHTCPCRHKDADGKRIHDFDYLHNFDYEHDYDYEHEWDYEHKHDTKHEYDVPHEFDTEHPFDPIHEFDMAHEWDPIHEFDLAHEWDPIHDYDVRFVPQEAK
ncbi:MAG: hypothetical protein ACHQ1G_01420 [Planctomycetota bacterium]